MRLPEAASPLSLTDQLAEFDIWITPSLGEIRDTERFQKELASVVTIFDALSESTAGFKSVETCSPDAITEALLTLVMGKAPAAAAAILRGAASVLFLTTGKSDNNAKCQLPLYLRDKAKWATFPTCRRRRRKPVVGHGPLPRVLKANDYMALVAALSGDAEKQKMLLREFVQFLLGDRDYVAQLWSIGHSYVMLKAFDRHRAILTPLVIFQVRGSVSASGGHAPEDKLRTRFDEWGLIRGVDYNVSDVVVAAERSGGRVKTRAYDFVLPFQTPGWERRLYIQSQFYAGDSGSVSHKNVDQTSTSRTKAIEQNREATFVEYLDGAGYFSSLNGDLKTLLSMANTASFFQVRSAPIRLRRALQGVGFLTPLEVEQAVVRTDGSRNAITQRLVREGYRKEEVERCLTVCAERKAIDGEGTRLMLREDRRDIVRRYIVLDAIACFGSVPDQSTGKVSGYVFVPGYGPFYGLKLVELLAKAMDSAPGMAREFADSKTMLGDIQWLEEQEWIMSA